MFVTLKTLRVQRFFATVHINKFKIHRKKYFKIFLGFRKNAGYYYSAAFLWSFVILLPFFSVIQ
jgi:hypothetical protein